MPLAEVKSEESPNCLSNLLKVAKSFEERQGVGEQRTSGINFLPVLKSSAGVAVSHEAIKHTLVCGVGATFKSIICAQKQTFNWIQKYF